MVGLEAELDRHLAQLRDADPVLGRVLAILALRVELLEGALLADDDDDDEGEDEAL